MERAPFPDVTGLRLRARSRDAFARSGAMGRASIETTVPAAALHARASAAHVALRSVLTAAWASVAYMYMAHELDVLAIDAIDTRHAVTLRLGPSLCDMHDAHSVLLAIESAWHGLPEPCVQGPLAFVDALEDDAPVACAFAARVLGPDVHVALVAHRGRNGHLALSLLATPDVHVAGSAAMQLRQVDATLSALADGTDPLALPDPLQALSTPPPQYLDIDQLHGIAHERLEDQFCRRARAMPQVPALVCCTSVSPLHMDTWTYAELDARSDAIARLVWTHGVGFAAPGDDDQIVALCLSKCHDMYASILGILKAGAAWCPIDPSWPAARQAALLEKSRARLVLTTNATSSLVRSVCPPAIHMASLDDPAPAVPVPERTARRASPKQLAYQIWTSGTTGLPKAVGIEHEAAVQAMRALQAAVPTDLPAQPGALRYLQFAAYVFDLSIFDMFYAWGHGGTVCFAPHELLLTRLVDVAQALAVTHTLFTPAVSAMVPRRAVPTMRVMINGGEKLSQVVADEWSQGCRVVNIYGPAEATLSLTSREIPHDDEVKAHNIGVPFVDALCVLVNEHGHIVPRGAIGELLLGGPQLARGYMGEPDKTAAKFVEHPTLGRLYHTGDLARYLWDGQLEYLGRNDDQVKINGVRIELLEINAAVKSASEHVRDADTVAMPAADPSAPPSIVAFAVAPSDARDAPLIRTDAEAANLARELRRAVSEMLPVYMMPLHFVILHTFPRTSSAKIDRRAVKAAYDDLDVAAWEAQVAGPAADAAGLLQHPLAVALCERLPELRAPGAAHLSFPLLGLNSVRAMALSAHLVSDGWPVSAADFAKHDTLAKLVAALDAAGPAKDRTAEAQAVSDAWMSLCRIDLTALGDAVRVLPATPLQQGMLLETSLDPARYWLYRSWPTRAPVAPAALQSAMHTLAAEMDCLRMGFVPVVCDSASPYAPVYAAVLHSSVAPTVHFYTGDAFTALAPHRPVCTSGAPLWLAACSTECVTLVLHHALYDEPTLEMLAERLDARLQHLHTQGSESWALALPDLLPLPGTESPVLAAWAQALRGAGDHTPWPALRETRAAPSSTLQRYVRQATTPWAALERAAAQLGASVRPMAHAAWARVLCAYLGTSAVLLGDVVSMRGRHASYARIGGPLLSTLPVAYSMDHGSVSAYVTHWLDTYAPLLDGPPVPLAHVRTLVACPAEQPLFHSLFVLEMPDAEKSGAVLDLPHARDQGVHVEHGLALEMRVQDEQLVLALNALESHVSPAYADQLLAQLDALLGAYAGDARTPLTALPMPPALLAVAPHVPPTTPRYTNVADWAAHYAARTPSAVAVEMRDDEVHVLTYAALHAQSAATAGALAAYAPRSVVAVALRRSLDTYVVLLGLLQAGLVYLPLDESLPSARKAQLVRDSGALCVVTDDADPAWAEQVPVHRPAELARHAPARRDVAAEDAAYVLYTSGSTGQPKGCLVSHANLAYAVDNFRTVFDDARPGSLRGARFLARSAEAFDVHLLECFLALQSGSTIVTMPRATLLADLGAAMANAQVTHACVVPSLFYTQGRRVVPRDVPHLRVLVVGGEKLADDIVDVWGASDIPVLNAYGPTEATIGISCTRVHADSRPSNIGRAFPGNQFVVLRTRDTAAMRGEPGELAIVGTHVGLGYVHASDAFFDWDGRRAYATGDRARMMPNGDIEYLGRTGHDQVKVRGARVELGEVEAVLRAGGASHVAVRLLTHAQRPEPHLVAFVAPATHVGAAEWRPEEDVTQLREFARAHLPSYMAPSVVLPLSFLPLARVSGKLDYGALADVYARYAPAATEEEAPPDTPEARTAARIVQQVLGAERVGLHTDLFGLGLDSLRAVRLAQALKEAGLAVSLPAILTQPTLAGLLAAAPSDAPAAEASDTLPCLPLQWATLAQSLAEPAQRLYINHVRLTLEATDEAPRCAYAQHWRDTLARFAIYRTVFELSDTASQRVLPALPRIEARVHAPCSDAALDAIADDILSCAASRPLVRLTLFDDVLCLSLHHAVYDAASLSLLMAAVDGDAAPDTFADVARLAAATSARSAAHYARVLDGMVRTPVPTLTGRYSTREPSVSLAYRARVSAKRLTAHAQRHKATLPALLLHEYAALLAQYAGEAESTLGVVLSGRLAHVDHAHAHGPCISTVPFRWTGRNLHAAHEQLAAAMAHPFVHLTDVAHGLHMDTALFEALFSFLPPTSSARPRGVHAVHDAMASDFPLALQVAVEADDALAFDVTYAPDRLAREQVQLFVEQLEDALRACIGEARTDLALRSVVHETPTEPALADAFLARFAAHVKARPQAEAITFATSLEPLVAQTLSYEELDRRSSVYAHHLAVLDGPAVYVHLPRTMDLYVVLLATWKAHKTYVPLDPTLPMERLAYMIDTVGPGTLVSAAPWPDVRLPVYTLADLARPCDACATEPSLDLPAYILFTSGSTGKPKGVQVSHRALAAAILSWEAMLPHTPASRLLQLASPGFDVSLFEVCLPLSLGFAVASTPKEALLTDLELAFRALRITMADLPAALAALIRPPHVPRLEWLMSGGDVIDERVVRAWGTPPQRLINAYGPTEGTIGNTLGFVDAHTRRSVVGDAYPTSTVWILEDEQVAYRGAVGEIVVGGPQVADGYVGAPALTATQFPTLRGARVYRTGDRGRMLSDGRIECLGRLARGQVKVNGQRVELDEIAHELAVEAGIADACVQYLQHPSHASRQLVAFVSLRAAPLDSTQLAMRTDDEAQQRAAACIDGARRRLAPYMVPAHTIVLAGPLPLTPNNKVDTKRLAAWYATLELRAQRDVAPLTERERTVLHAMEQISGQPVDRHASFYALGFDSLSAIRLVRALRDVGVRVTVSELLQHATPARLARAMDEARASTGDDAQAYAALCEAGAALLQEPGTCPCTPLQAGMLAQWASSGGALYVHTHVWDVNSAPPSVEAAWRALVAQHDLLRTHFVAHEHAAVPWVQVTRATSEPPVRTHNHAAWAAVCAEARSTCDASQPCALDLLPTAHGTRMILTLHHALYDAHTLGQILEDLDAALDGRAVPLRPSFATVVPHLASGEPHVPYWLDTLAGHVPAWLAPPGAERVACTAERATSLTSAEIVRVCQSLGVSVHAFATLAFACLLAECTGSSDVCFGQVLSLRSDVDGGVDVLGPILNTVPTRIVLSDATVGAQLQALQAQIDASRPHRHAPLRAIGRAHQRTHTSPAPLIDALLDVQRHETTEWVHLTPVPLPSDDAAQYALNVEVVQTERVALVARSRVAFRDAQGLAALLERMEDLLHAMTTPSNTLTLKKAALRPLAPRTAPGALVERLRALLADLARVPVEDVEAETPLLALGLDSIAAIQVVARARAQGWDLQVSDLTAGTPQGVAAAWTERQRSAPAPLPSDDWRHEADGVHAHVPFALDEVLPVAAGQAMHLRQWVQSGYRVGWFAFVYESHLCDVERWRAAWEQLQQRHAILRTLFVCVGGRAWQAVVPTTRPLRVHPRTTAAHDAVQAVLDERTQPLADVQPWIAADVVPAAESLYVVLHLFHSMYDAWSLPLLLDDLVAFYEGRAPCARAGMSELVALAPDAAAVARHWAELRAVPPCVLGATDRPVGDAYTFVHRMRAVRGVERLRVALAQHDASLPALIAAAWAHVLHQFTGAAAPVFLLYHAARAVPMDHVAERAIPCLNLLPTVVPHTSSLMVMAQRTTATLSERVPLEHASLEQIYEATERPPSTLCNTTLNILRGSHVASAPSALQPRPALTLPRLTHARRMLPSSTFDAWPGAQFVGPHMVHVDVCVEADDTLSMALRCPAAVLGGAEAEAILRVLADTLHIP
ncbi:NRPS [Malassezia caprae]|uniref:NRPS n=1 Tax=Malassezia caprae TaxID=1381934 RepID=A0AAF0IVD7_9BASI|nr:NRPS [Malassezia caprae]